ncbi:hypothetical protein MSPP1_002269 [Malassezia sp. CBS 17886]|nr:hypothetical protein MSPP1_002269 [Malassezia sp. CBS 17886]
MTPDPPSKRRLGAIVRHFQSGPVLAQDQADDGALGTFRLGPHVAIPVHMPDAPERIPPARLLLDLEDPLVLEHLEFLGKKWQLRQDVFLSSPPGPYTRRLCETFAALIQVPVEYVSLHRDIGEAELLQTRSLSAGGSLRYDDGPVVRAMKHGHILILDGIERAERGVMPVLNNILENREHNLPDGTQLVPPGRLPPDASAVELHRLVPVHPDFRVFCLGIPVPPYQGHPLDPPFRSRFQARWVEGSVYPPAPSTRTPLLPAAKTRADDLARRWAEWAALLQMHTDLVQGTGKLPLTEQLPHVPATALPLLRDTTLAFPPAEALAPVPERAPEAARVTPSTRDLLSTAYPALLDMADDKRSMLDELIARTALDGGVGDGTGGFASGGGDGGDGSTALHSGIVHGATPHTHGAGLLNYEIAAAERRSESTAALTFRHVATGAAVEAVVPCGPLPLVPLEALARPDRATEPVVMTPRVRAVLTTMLQLHSVGRDICLVPTVLQNTARPQASSSKALCIRLFGELLGYPVETVWLYKDVSGNELVMRRATTPDGATTWVPSQLTRAALQGTLVHLAGVDVLGPTLSSLARLTQDREMELWNGIRLTLGPDGAAAPPELLDGGVYPLAPPLRIVATAPTPVKWLTESVATMFGTVAAEPMDEAEEREIVSAYVRCDAAQLDTLFAFARRYRDESADPNVGLHKARRLGTRQLIRVARRLAHWPGTDLYALLWRNQLADFLPSTVRGVLKEMLVGCGIVPHGAEGAFQYIPPLVLQDPRVDSATNELVFADEGGTQRLAVPRYDWRRHDPSAGALIPNALGSFFHNPEQTGMMYSFVQDLAVLGEHLLLMGAQGTGKNKLIDQTLELLDRPREYIQMNRDSTVAEVLQRAYLEDGQLKYADSPLVRAVRLGRVVVVDEVDKCSPSVSAVFKSLAERGELSLPDGRRIVPPGSAADAQSIVVHPDFRLVLLANRPGWPFLGNSFTDVIGEGFSTYAVANPDVESEMQLLERLAPNVSKDLLRSLVLAFHDLREAFDADLLNYPYSLRELIHLVRHLNRYPDEELGDVVLNVLSFDLHKPEAMKLVMDTFARRGLRIGDLSLEAMRAKMAEKAGDPEKRVEYKPAGDTSLDKPKPGKEDPENEPHVGGNTWRGGTGGRDTAGLGGRGGFERLYKGHKIHQVSDELKSQVPEHIKEQAREMANQALEEKLKRDGLTKDEEEYVLVIKEHVAAQTQHLTNVLNALTANEHERTWMVRQQDGQLDERRLGDGLVGERAIFKRRQEAPPEIGAPQVKPKRVRIVIDASASMYHMQFDGRLTRELEAVMMLLEAMARVDPGRFAFDMVAHSGDSSMIPLVKLGQIPQTDGDRFRVLRDIVTHTRFCFTGDNTLECIQESVREVRKDDAADDYFVIALSDANLARYFITPEQLGRAMKSDEKVKSAVIFIDRGAEATKAARILPGRAFVAPDTKEIPRILSDILTSMLNN